MGEEALAVSARAARVQEPSVCPDLPVCLGILARVSQGRNRKSGPFSWEREIVVEP